MGENKRNATELLEICKNFPRAQAMELLLIYLILFSEWKYGLYVKVCNMCVAQAANAYNDCYEAVELIRARIKEMFAEAREMNDKQSLILAPPVEYSCPHCSHWRRYPPGEHITNPSWGTCTLKGVPRYMNETHESRGCNKHSRILSEKQEQARAKEYSDNGQLSLF